MSTSPDLPKKGDKIKSAKKIKVANNSLIKVLSGVGPDTLDKGVKGVIHKVDSSHIEASFYWMNKGKFDLDLRVAKAIWGDSFEKQ
jgi:hypothetical protein